MNILICKTLWKGICPVILICSYFDILLYFLVVEIDQQ